MEKAANRFLSLALIATLIAIGLHVYLAKQHYGLKFGSASGASVCNVSSTFSCDAVAASSYSAAFGIPLALFGAVANGVLAFLLLITYLKWTDEPEATGRYSVWLAGLIALTSVGMATVSFTQMTAYCLFCIACYLLSFVSLFGAWKGAGGLGPSPVNDLMALFTTRRWLLLVAVAIPALAFVVNASAEKGAGYGDVERVSAEKISEWTTAPVKNFDLSKGLVLQTGTAEPIMTIVEFADFRCPHCKHAYPSLHAFTQAHPDVKLVYKTFPLDGTCNASMKGGGDGLSCRMAAIVQCEEKLNKNGWAAHHYFFDNQEALFPVTAVEDLSKRYCEERGADCAALKTCLENPETMDEVRAIAQEGADAEIRGTPAIFVNGRLLVGGQLLPVLEAARKSLKK